MDREPVTSSVLAEVGYDELRRTLEVVFRSGAIYLYYFVPPELHSGLMSAASHGTFFNKEIKGVYEHQRIAEPRELPKRRTRKPGSARPASRKRR